MIVQDMWVCKTCHRLLIKSNNTLNGRIPLVLHLKDVHPDRSKSKYAEFSSVIIND